MNTDTSRITLNGLKLNLTFSRETYCFTTKIHHGRTEVGYAENDGHGGCTFVTFNAAGLALNLDRKAIEEKVDSMVDDAAKEKDNARIVRKVRKDMATKVCFIKAGEFTAGAYSYCKHNGTPEAAAATDKAMRAKYPDATFLADLGDAALLHTLGL